MIIDFINNLDPQILQNQFFLYNKTKNKIKCLFIISIILITPHKVPIFTMENLLDKLIRNINHRKPKYILFLDYIESNVCSDENAYLVFKYLLEKNFRNAYYFINSETELYKNLYETKKAKNIIPLDGNEVKTYKMLYPFLLNSKLIVASYITYFNYIVNKVFYLKLLYLTHAINYFKLRSIISEGQYLNDDKRKSVILSSPFEYYVYQKLKLYKNESFYIAGLPRFDRFQNSKKNKSEKDCILISFTYRLYNNEIYEQSLFKKNLIKLINDESLISFLNDNNVDLIISQHHHDVRRGRQLKKKELIYAKYCEQKNLSHYIEQCSLYITDFSTVSFDFMFQNKPVLFYFLDANDTIDFDDKKYMKIEENYNIYFENVFYNQEQLIQNIKYYVINKYKLKEGLVNKYNQMFYIKKNITGKIADIIIKLINK